MHNVRVAKNAPAGAYFSGCVVQSATTSIAEVFFCMRRQSFVLRLCRHALMQTRFSRIHPPPIAFNVAIPPPIAFNVAITLVLCSILQGINGDDDTERSVANYFGLCVLVVLGTFQARCEPRGTQNYSIYRAQFKKSTWHVKCL